MMAMTNLAWPGHQRCNHRGPRIRPGESGTLSGNGSGRQRLGGSGLDCSRLGDGLRLGSRGCNAASHPLPVKCEEPRGDQQRQRPNDEIAPRFVARTVDAITAQCLVATPQLRLRHGVELCLTWVGCTELSGPIVGRAECFE